MPTTLNPAQFGAEVVDQFGRYLMTTFPIADDAMEAQVRAQLRHGVGGQTLIAKGPYVHLSRPFEEGPSVQAMVDEPDLGLHRALSSVFPYPSLHKHQELALRAGAAGRHLVVATGTGSGKTEAFLLPLIDHCLKLRDEGAPDGVAAVIVYPMNALADDQLRRLRPLLAGTRISFGRYTGVTPETAPESLNRLEHSRPYNDEEKAKLQAGKDEDVPLPWEECPSREAIRERKPRILLTNYSQLEYLLLRDRDLDLFRGAPLRFLVLDEVHTYTGALGSEVACLIRRLRHVAGKTADDVLCIGTSATVQDTDGKLDAHEATRNFVHRLFGVPQDDIEMVTEHYQRTVDPDDDLYVPPPPDAPRKLLEDILGAVRDLQLLDEVEDIPADVLGLLERLTGQTAPAGTRRMEGAYGLLRRNAAVQALKDRFHHPGLIRDGVEHLRAFDRADRDDEDLTAEILAYLTLGALVQDAGEPLLRPKLHYFVQGLHGLACAFDAEGKPQVHFEADAGHTDDGARIFPLVLCRSCGQHYLPLICTPTEAVQDGAEVKGVALTRSPDRFEEPEGDESLVYVTNHLVSETEGADPTAMRYLCRICGALHDEPGDHCRNPKCGHEGPLLAVHEHRGDITKCLACESWAKGFDDVVTPARSSEVADVTILAQSMLSAMPEEQLRKLLIFSDNRQDAAFQAGWMDERSRRFRLRHILHSVLEGAGGKPFNLDRLTREVVDEALRRGVLFPKPYDDQTNETKVRWFLLEEFASTGQRRNSLESLALAEVLLHGIDADTGGAFYGEWAARFGISAEALANVVRLMLDYHRRRGTVSDPLLQRKWTPQDPEVRDRLVHTYDHYRPAALALERTKDRGGYTRGWIASNGRAAAQDILRAALPPETRLDSKVVNEFLVALWEWLVERKVLVPVKLLYRQHGHIKTLRIPESLYQINAANLGFRTTKERYVCPACRRSQAVAPPSGACPEYGCKGHLSTRGRDLDHYDVHQYTRSHFVPLQAREHTAQVPKEDRIEIEGQFKRETGGSVNCLVCTPTLEMGVDIGKLEMVLMRNAPPTPANYAQRAGRAGRRHRIAVVFTYCRGSSHDRYFFHEPPAMIAGEIRVPAFSMSNEPLIRKHVHSTVLTTLRERKDPAVAEILDHAFPPFIWAYLGDRTVRNEGGQEKTRFFWAKEPRDLSDLAATLAGGRDDLLGTLRDVFQSSWPADDATAVADDALGSMLDDTPGDLSRHIRGLFAQVQAYRKELRRLRELEEEGELDAEERKQRQRFGHALSVLLSDRMDNYTLGYLGVDGFFPGYAMSRQSVTALCPEPYLEISRPSTVALRELTSANFIYANRDVFRVRKLAFHRLQAEEKGASSTVLQRQVAYHDSPERLTEPGAADKEGGEDSGPMVVDSMEMTEVEMRRKQVIDDQERGRHRVGFTILGMELQGHAGGRQATVGSYTVQYLQRQHLRLVNLGFPWKGTPLSLFPLCPVCGATRSPRASDAELARFEESHTRTCGQAPGKYGLHVELCSDVLRIGPFPEDRDATNVFEALRFGARRVLDMGETEIEGMTLATSSGEFWSVLYDPMPGGSGFLPQIARYWDVVCDKAREALDNCPSDCETSCYSCLRHFRNQQAHDQLDRHLAVEWMNQLGVPLALEHPVPAVAVQPKADKTKTDSDAEVTFVTICEQRDFPVPPAAQYRVDLGTTFTVADWAYPDANVLVYIDGMSEQYHGSAEQQRKDARLRAMLRMKGYNVVAITAEELFDEAALAGKLEEIAVYLGACCG